MRIAEVDLDADLMSEPGMFRHFRPAIIGQRLTPDRRNMAKLTGEGLVLVPFSGDAEGVFAIQLHQDEVAGVVRSINTPTAERWAWPMIKSPSQWPGTCRSAASAGRS